MGQLWTPLYRGLSSPPPSKPKTKTRRLKMSDNKAPHGYIIDSEGNTVPDPNPIIEPDPLEELKAKVDSLKDELDNVKVDVDGLKDKTKTLL